MFQQLTPVLSINYYNTIELLREIKYALKIFEKAQRKRKMISGLN